MARTDNELRVTISVLDRLIDYEPEMSSEAIASRQKSLRQLKQSVKRDLEWLLNTRQVVGGVPSELKEVSASLAAYGLPDFTAVGVKSAAEQNRIRREIESAIAIFEPRLSDVSVHVEPFGQTERMLRFRIDARLMIDPAPEPITFDTALHVSSGQYVVQGD